MNKHFGSLNLFSSLMSAALPPTFSCLPVTVQHKTEGAIWLINNYFPRADESLTLSVLIRCRFFKVAGKHVIFCHFVLHFVSYMLQISNDRSLIDADKHPAGFSSRVAASLPAHWSRAPVIVGSVFLWLLEGLLKVKHGLEATSDRFKELPRCLCRHRKWCGWKTLQMF